MNPFAIRTLVRIGAGILFAYIVYWLISVMESVTTILMVSFLISQKQILGYWVLLVKSFARINAHNQPTTRFLPLFTLFY